MQIQVIGGGSWGLALTRVLALNNQNVRLWCRPEDDPDPLRETRESKKFLPGVLLPAEVVIAPEVNAAADMVVYAVPSHAMRPVVPQLAFDKNPVRVSVAKGIENDTLLRMSEIIAALAPGSPVVALSGPSHAEEVGRGLPASLVAASADEEACKKVQEAFFCSNFRVYTSPDIIGVELGGSLKNVVAIAAGVCDGLGLGDNAKSALITRGLAEITRLGLALGARAETFMGLSGLGDLVLTATGDLSRNRQVGLLLAKGQTLAQAVQSLGHVAEGVYSARTVVQRAQLLGVQMPIAESVVALLDGQLEPQDAVLELMGRDPVSELG